jgi:hypothetical protein
LQLLKPFAQFHCKFKLRDHQMSVERWSYQAREFLPQARNFGPHIFDGHGITAP